MKDEKGKSGIRIEKLFLNNMVFQLYKAYEGGPLPELEIDFNYEARFPEPNKLEAIVKTKIVTGTKPSDFDLNISMTGIFVKEGDGEPSLETFSKYNAPAHMYPFIRETVASIVSKASYPPIILPPINLIQTAQMGSTLDT